MATTSSQRPSEALPSTSYNEGEADQLRMVNPRTMDVVTEAREHLAFKASIKLKDMSIDWSDRSKRPVSQKHINQLKTSFKEESIMKEAACNRMFLGVREQDVRARFRNQNMGGLEWISKWLPDDSDGKAKLALEQFIGEIGGGAKNLTWVAYIYYLDTIPPALLINLGGNASTVHRPTSSGELFRDMVAIAPVLAKADTDIVRPHLVGDREGQVPTVHEFLKPTRQGQKSMIKARFAETLTTCAAANNDTLDKMLAILGIPLRQALKTWTTFGVGLEMFQIHGIYEMLSSQCLAYWAEWFEDQNEFYSAVMEGVPGRYFDMSMQDDLANLQPWNQATMDSMFWPDVGRECQLCPIMNQMRSSRVLQYVSDQEYLSIYKNLCKPEHMSYALLSRKQFGDFIKHSVPAVRLVAHHVVYWLVPDAQKKLSAGRFGGKVDWQHTLATSYFTEKHYSEPEAAAAGLICLLTQFTYDHVQIFSPKKRVGLDSYPTVKTVNPTSKKESKMKVANYMGRFRTYWAWFHLAKSVARFCGHGLVEGFMQVFNDSEYSCFGLEKTNIRDDLVEGRTSLQNHDEVRTNPVFASKEGKAVIAQIKADLRRAVFARISTVDKATINRFPPPGK